jgi:hypothetical protein
MAGENEDYLSSLVTKDGRPANLEERAYDPKTGKHVQRTLNRVVKIGMLPTPTQRDWKSGAASDETMSRNARPLNEVVTNQTGSAGPMRLNPQFVVWLMGYPPDWLEGVECPRSRRSAMP